MIKKINRRNFFFINKKYQYIFFISIILITLTIIISYNKNYIFNRLKLSLELFSLNFNYQYTNLKVSGLNRIDYNFIEDKLKKYEKSSIFLLPLNKINKELKENNWIKNLELSTDYKNTLIVNIIEYEPLGIYEFNKKKFYFDKNGKIIDQAFKNTTNSKKLLIFYGNSSNLNAYSLIKIINDLKFQKKYNIKRIDLINKRRWNIILDNNIKLMLSENDPKLSLQNFIIIKNKLSQAEINNIKQVDLRDTNKTLITYNK